MVFHRCGSFCVVSGLIFVRKFYHIDHTEKDAHRYGFVNVLLKIVLLVLNFNCKIELQGCCNTVSDKSDDENRPKNVWITSIVLKRLFNTKPSYQPSLVLSLHSKT